MAEFPSKVTTETSAPQSDGGQQGGNSLRGLAAGVTNRMDQSFIRSIPAILMLVEIVSGLLQWTLIASAYIWALPVYGWVMFVAVTLWLFTSLLFCLILFEFQSKLVSVPWPLTVMLYHTVAAILCLTAFLANAASVYPYRYHVFTHGHFGAAAFFGAVTTVAYGASAYFSYLDWRGDRGNGASGTGPS
ncbi:plasmolipin [Gadus macrocephalus]|uniref:plasmolipin n=1 Tax=Gadus macrocephalus TaxID=80720 RepID=UPI0028CB20F6|nr:plasmolipin [Gadus macrocephalus]